MNTNQRNASCRRPGVILVIALVAVTLGASLWTVSVRFMVTHHRQVRLREHEIQAHWLVESAFARAAKNLSANRAYDGETWRVSPAELGGPYEAEVTIRVEADPDRDARRYVDVTVAYPPDSIRRIFKNQRIAIDTNL